MLGLEIAEPREQRSRATSSVRTRLAKLENNDEAQGEELRRLKAQVQKLYAVPEER